MTRPIRVLRIIARLNVGGPAIHVALLTQKLSTPHYESILVCGSVDDTEGDMAYYAEQRGVTPHILPALGRQVNVVADLKAIAAFVKMMRELKPDVVHTHTAKAGFTGRIAARIAGVPVVVHTFHGHVFRGYFGTLKTRLYVLLEQITARFSDAVITLTDSLKRELVDTFHIAPQEHIVVLPLGFDLTPFTEAVRKNEAWRREWGIPETAPLVTMVARMVAVKNHALFLQAAVHVRELIPNVRFALVGDGVMRDSLEAQVDALGLRDAVVFTGWQRNMAAIYADADVLAVSSLNEGTPVSIIEALATGCPVVATAVGGVPDLLEDGKLGTLVPSGNAKALAEGIVEVLRNPPDLTAVRTVMVQRYDVNRLARDMDALYRRLLAAKGKL